MPPNINQISLPPFLPGWRAGVPKEWVQIAGNLGWHKPAFTRSLHNNQLEFLLAQTAGAASPIAVTEAGLV